MFSIFLVIPLVFMMYLYMAEFVIINLSTPITASETIKSEFLVQLVKTKKNV